MAHDGTGAGWDESSPTNAEFVKDGAKEIRDLRIGLRDRVDKEHVAPAAASVGGEHSAGSAKSFYGGSAPTLRPDGATSLNSSDQGRFWIDGGVLKYWNGVAWVAVTVGSTRSIAILADVKASGSHGGSSVSGFQTRTLNTQVSDDQNIVTSLSSNKFVLASGTYYIKASAPALQNSGHQIRLWNVTSAASVIAGSPAFSSGTAQYADSRSELEGVFTANGTDEYRIEHKVETTGSDTRSLGRGLSSGESQTFTRVFLEKIG